MHLCLLFLLSTLFETASSVLCEGCVPVFYHGLNGSSCFRIPTIIKSSKGTLLAFAENRVTDCGDNGAQHDLVLRRSDDQGMSWGPLITVAKGKVPCPGCPAAISNPNPVDVLMGDGSRKILLHYDTMNNPNPAHHGIDMQMWSDDDGITWSQGTALSFGATTNNTGALIGPSVGIQATDGTIYFSMVFEDDHWLYWSKDLGKSWTASKPVKGVGECSIAFLVDSEDGRIIMNCRTNNHQRAQIIWSPDGIPSPMTWPGIIDPGCQGSIINNEGILHVSNANTTSSRTHMVVKSSHDQGKSWNNGVLVYPGASGYSQLVALEANGLGLLFETDGMTIAYVAVAV